jgi:hypothetical protein
VVPKHNRQSFPEYKNRIIGRILSIISSGLKTLQAACIIMATLIGLAYCQHDIKYGNAKKMKDT